MRRLSSRELSLAAVAATALLAAAPARPARPAELPVVQPNDNRAAAGRWRGDTLALQLVVRRARWFPEAEGGPSIIVDAFGEEGRAPQIPAPLIRVRAGTPIVATVRNALPDSTITVHGLHTRPAATWGVVRLAPGETRTVRFTAGTPGTYLYFASVGTANPDSAERETTGGALVVDAPGARRDDRVLVINIWGYAKDSLTYPNALAINGKSWPWSERLSASLGDSVRYRLVNASTRVHPMHLHGFYFRLDAEGDGLGDTTFAPAARRLAVTETMLPGSTMDLVWYADRPGNWLLHCHLAFHVIPEAALLESPPAGAHHALSADPAQHMAGLIMGITVRPPRGWREPPRPEPQRLRLLVQEGRPRGRSPRAMGYVLQEGDAPPAPDSIRIAGPVLVLTRGRPADITIVNHLDEPTGVHWHGIELESYSDGVVGWSGAGRHVAPPVAPGDSFVAHLLQPRAGTFIYHTHLGDLVQLTSGLYGAIVVLEPGQRFDPRTDHVFVAGWDGDADPPHLLVNGDSLPKPLELAAGTTHRLRFVNIGAAGFVRFAMKRDTSLVRWHALARDGADLDAAMRVERPAAVVLNVGQTADAGFEPREAGEYVLEIAHVVKARVVSSRRQRIIVR
jgi:FtsP/CotA-like multicopper oxidase with cupredoxin domain